MTLTPPLPRPANRKRWFPPPARLAAPLLVLVFGWLATWLDYHLALDLDLARHLEEVREHAATHAQRLARLSEALLAGGLTGPLQSDLRAMDDLPLLEIAGVVDVQGRVVADVSGSLQGLAVAETRLAAAARLINTAGQPALLHGENEVSVFAACPFKIGEGGTGWALIEMNRSAAIAGAQGDAWSSFLWTAGAMALLSFLLWAVLHFGFASRIALLARNVRDFGEGRAETPSLIPGGDEVAELSEAFVATATKLREREVEQLSLERELLNISERERQRIGRDLHDGLGQQLTAASMGANALVEVLKNDAPSLVDRGEAVGRQIREAIVEARALSHGLAPVTLREDGLLLALQELADSLNRNAMHCVFEAPEPIQVSDAEVSIQLFRIAQEAVNNALKHACPTEIRIGLERQEDFLLLEVEDDGGGIDENASASPGLGLRVMHYRAHLVGGALEIGPAPAGGTRVCCRVKVSRNSQTSS